MQSLDKALFFFIELKVCKSDFYFLNRRKKCKEATYSIVSVYMLKTRPLPCTVVLCVGRRGRDQGVACLVLTGCGIAVSEIIGVIRNAAFKFVSLRPKSHLIAPNRKWTQKILFARANAY